MNERNLPTSCFDGQIIYVRQNGEWITAKVTRADGVIALVENQVRSIRGWFFLHEMRLRKPTTAVDRLA